VLLLQLRGITVVQVMRSVDDDLSEIFRFEQFQTRTHHDKPSALKFRPDHLLPTAGRHYVLGRKALSIFRQRV